MRRGWPVRPPSRHRSAARSASALAAVSVAVLVAVAVPADGLDRSADVGQTVGGVRQLLLGLLLAGPGDAQVGRRWRTARRARSRSAARPARPASASRGATAGRIVRSRPVDRHRSQVAEHRSWWRRPGRRRPRRRARPRLQSRARWPTTRQPRRASSWSFGSGHRPPTRRSGSGGRPSPPWRRPRHRRWRPGTCRRPRAGLASLRGPAAAAVASTTAWSRSCVGCSRAASVSDVVLLGRSPPAPGPDRPDGGRRWRSPGARRRPAAARRSRSTQCVPGCSPPGCRGSFVAPIGGGPGTGRTWWWCQRWSKGRVDRTTSPQERPLRGLT